MTYLRAAPVAFHRMTTTRLGTVWIASCSCGEYIGLVRNTAAEAMQQGTDEHEKQLKAGGASSGTK